MIALLSLMMGQAATPLPAPPQVIPGHGAIPEMRGGPLLPYPANGVSARNWSCEVSLGQGAPVRIAGTFGAIAPEPNRSPVPRRAPVAEAQVQAGEGHAFAGAYQATYSPSDSIYAFNLQSGEDAYEIIVRLYDGVRPGRISVARNEIDNIVGEGSCRPEAEGQGGAL